jgi:hypothetical protein
LDEALARRRSARSCSLASVSRAGVVIGAFDDHAVGAALRLSPGERPLALMPIGWPA